MGITGISNLEPLKMSNKFVAILMGSDSDLPVMQSTYDTLKKLGITVEMKITSAHRTPQATHEYVKDAEARGCQIFICAAGLAAHLAGAVAGLTTRPVIGVPMDGGPLQGEDALLSTVQMPGGVPVATVYDLFGVTTSILNGRGDLGRTEAFLPWKALLLRANWV